MYFSAKLGRDVGITIGFEVIIEVTKQQAADPGFDGKVPPVNRGAKLM